MTFDPDHHDADDQPTVSSEWDQPIATPRGNPCLRAAVFLWVLGAVESLLFGCVTAGALQLAMIPEHELRQTFESAQASPEMVDQVIRARPMFVPMAVTTLIMGLFPGLAYLGLGFPVRLGRRAAIGFALLLAITQGIVAAVLMVWGIIAAVSTANPSAFTGNVLLFGTPLLLIGLTIYWLLQARQTVTEASNGQAEP